MSSMRKRPTKLAGLKRPPAKLAAHRKGGSLLGAMAGPMARATGWPALDDSQIAFRGGELTLLAGRSAHGKSNFLLNLMLNWLEQDPSCHIFFYSLEMTPQQAAARLLTILVAKHGGASISATQALKFLKEAQTLPPVGAGIETLRRLEERIHFVYEPLWDVDQLATDVLTRRAEGIGAVIVDPLTGLSVPPQRMRQDRRDLELSHISRRLKEIAVRLNCPVIGAAPTRAMRFEEGEEIRALIGKGREFQDMEIEDAIRARRPRLSHLSEGSLEQEADMVLSLLSYLSDFQQEMEPDHRLLFQSRTKGLLEISALKNRLGPLENAELEMDSKTSLVRDNPHMKSL
jgi:replicative DNA helicase